MSKPSRLRRAIDVRERLEHIDGIDIGAGILGEIVCPTIGDSIAEPAIIQVGRGKLIPKKGDRF